MATEDPTGQPGVDEGLWELVKAVRNTAHLLGALPWDSVRTSIGHKVVTQAQDAENALHARLTADAERMAALLAAVDDVLEESDFERCRYPDGHDPLQVARSAFPPHQPPPPTDALVEPLPVTGEEPS